MRIDRRKLVLAMMDTDLNTKEVASKAGVSRATVSAVKNGRSCTEETAIRIAAAVNKDLEELKEV